MALPCKQKVLALAFSSDGQVVRVAENGLLRNVDVASSKVLSQHKFKKGEISRAAFSRDGKRLAVSSEKRLLLLDADSGKLLLEHKLNARERGSSVQWTRDGRLLHVCCVRFMGGKSSATLFDASGKELRKLVLPEDPQASRAALCGEVLHYDALGWLVACSLDGTARGRVKLKGIDRLVETPAGTLVMSKDEGSLLLFGAALGKPKSFGKFPGVSHLEPVGDSAVVLVSKNALIVGLDGKKKKGELELPEFETVHAVAGTAAGAIAAVVLYELRLS